MDEGNEFIIIRQNINLFHVNSDKKACIVERFTRTLKDKMWRSFTDRNKHKYIDTLDDLSIYKFKFKVGDIVRYRVWKDMRFDKGYTQNWTEEVFTVCERLPRVPSV